MSMYRHIESLGCSHSHQRMGRTVPNSEEKVTDLDSWRKKWVRFCCWLKHQGNQIWEVFFIWNFENESTYFYIYSKVLKMLSIYALFHQNLLLFGIVLIISRVYTLFCMKISLIYGKIGGIAKAKQRIIFDSSTDVNNVLIFRFQICLECVALWP